MAQQTKKLSVIFELGLVKCPANTVCCALTFIQLLHALVRLKNQNESITDNTLVVRAISWNIDT